MSRKTKKIASRLRSAMSRAGYEPSSWPDLERFAEERGMSASTVRWALKGNGTPRVDTLFQLCKGLDVQLSDLLAR